jgi:hypothetical protein
MWAASGSVDKVGARLKPSVLQGSRFHHRGTEAQRQDTREGTNRAEREALSVFTSLYY